MSDISAAAAGDVVQQEIMSKPLLRPAAILENVPGLLVTQHSGEGKANQYFLRALNLDHGTDLALEVDDMPVNMPTHAHGQGYSDVNFVIPELAGELRYKRVRTTPMKATSRPPEPPESASNTASEQQGVVDVDSN